MSLPRLVVATRNAHKTLEIRGMLTGKFEVFDTTDFPQLPEIPETGETFLANARLKAQGISQEIPGWVLSDDSGLEVDALEGSPGVVSSSFGGEEGNHAKNNARLMAEMAGETRRSARFRCTMVLMHDGKEVAHFDGSVEGTIAGSLRGNSGFGYDPLFIPDGYTRTFGELPATVKNSLSHRAQALAKVVAWLAVNC